VFGVVVLDLGQGGSARGGGTPDLRSLSSEVAVAFPERVDAASVFPVPPGQYVREESPAPLCSSLWCLISVEGGLPVFVGVRCPTPAPLFSTSHLWVTFPQRSYHAPSSLGVCSHGFLPQSVGLVEPIHGVLARRSFQSKSGN